MINRVDIDSRIRYREARQLIVEPKVVYVREFTTDSVKKFTKDINACHSTGQNIIPIVIDSYGGEVYALLAMIDILESAHLPIATIVEGKAFSCGGFLFSFGANGYRFMGPHATIMIHDVACEFLDDKVEDLKISTKEVDRLNKKCWRHMEKNIGQPANFLWDLNQLRGRTDWFMTSKEAQRYNIANHVRIPSLQTKISVDTQLI